MAGFILCRKSRDEDVEHESLHRVSKTKNEGSGLDYSKPPQN